MAKMFSLEQNSFLCPLCIVYSFVLMFVFVVVCACASAVCILCLHENSKHTFLTDGTLTILDCNGNKSRWSKCQPSECSIDDSNEWMNKGNSKKRTLIIYTRKRHWGVYMLTIFMHYTRMDGWMRQKYQNSFWIFHQNNAASSEPIFFRV